MTANNGGPQKPPGLPIPGLKMEIRLEHRLVMTPRLRRWIDHDEAMRQTVLPKKLKNDLKDDA